MSIFVAALAAGRPESEAGSTVVPVFQRAVRAARLLFGGSPTSVVQEGRACIAAFPRENGTGGAVSVHSCGSWLLSCGSPLHAAGLNGPQLLARALEIGPTRLARELEGPFAVLCFDSRRQELSVMTDLAGLRHVYRLDDARGVLLLSNSSALLASLTGGALDGFGCQEFLRTNQLTEGRTFFREVRRLSPASVYRFGERESHEHHWRASDVALDAVSGRKAADRLMETLAAAVRRIAPSAGALAVDLTAGYDSRGVVAGCLSAGARFSACVSGPEGCSDVRISRRLASTLGVPHLHFGGGASQSYDDVSAAAVLTDGEVDAVEYAEIARVHRQHASSHVASLNGSGGELGRGRSYQYILPRIPGAHEEWDPSRLVRLFYGEELSSDPTLFPASRRFDVHEHVIGTIRRANTGLLTLPNTLQLDHWYLERMRNWHGRIASSTDRIWPVFTPYLFRSVIEVLLGTDLPTRRRSYLFRRMLADHHPRLARIDTGNHYPPIPFTPLTAWRFWKLPYRYGQRVASRLARIAGRSSAVASSFGGRPPARLALLEDPRTSAALDPKAMFQSEILEGGALTRFLKRARQPGKFLYEAQWCRMLTLETICRKVAEVRASLRRAAGESDHPPRPVGMPPLRVLT